MSIQLKQTSPLAFVQITTNTSIKISEIWREDRNGKYVVRGSNPQGGLDAGTNIINDYEATFGKVVYTLVTVDNQTESAQLTIPLGLPVIVNLYDPSDNVRIDAITDYSYTRESRSIIHQTLGTAAPVVTLKPAQPRNVTITIETSTHAVINQLEQMLSRAYVFMLKIPEHDTLDLYFVLKSMSITTTTPQGAQTAWQIVLDITQVDWPTGNLERESFNTYGESLEQFATYFLSWTVEQTYTERYLVQ